MSVEQRQMDEFLAAASEYCELFETAKDLGSEQFLLRLARTLPRLQAAGVHLIFPVPDEGAEELDLRLSLEESQIIGEPVYEVLSEVDWSRIEGDLPESGLQDTPRPLGPIAHFLYDDLTDIYLDLKAGFRRIEAGGPGAEQEAFFEWRLHFWGHWGYHNVEALRLIHYYVALYLDG
jgi:uncharacterized protein DUF5063